MKHKICTLAQVILTLLSLNCNSLFYYPSKEVFYAPETNNIEYREIFLNVNESERICAWVFPVENSIGTIVQFHGNAQNMSSHYLSVLWLQEHGFEIVAFDYRGYGCSDGEAKKENARADGFTLVNHVLKQNKKPLYLYGQSLGGIVLQETLLQLREDQKREISGVILEGTFSSYQKIANVKMSESWLTWPFQWLAYILVSDTGAPNEDLSKLTSNRFLVVHGDQDPVVPFVLGQEIFEKLGSPNKQFLSIKNGKHIDAFHREFGKYRPDLLQFLKPSR